MLALDRQKAIVEYLKANHSATVNALSRKFFISETSIRRDLTKLERAGFLKKIHGGAILSEGHNHVLALEARQNVEKDEKLAIARKAASLIKNGDVVFLDSSSTVLAMADFLGGFNQLTVITHGLKLADALSRFPHLKLYLLGGLLNPSLHSLNGGLTRKNLEGLHADRVFLSPRALDIRRGAFCADEDEAEVRRAMLDRSGQTILLCSRIKLGTTAPFFLCRLNEIHTLVTDTLPEEESELKAIIENGVTVL